jgi:hypothetical protein
MTAWSPWLRLRSSRELYVTILRFLILIVVAGTLNSCLPGPHGAYYRPSYPDDTAVFKGGDCGGQAGPPSVINIPMEDGFIGVRLDKNSSGQLELSMSLETSGHSTLQFTSNVIRVTDLDKGTEWEINARGFSLNRQRYGEIPYTKAVDFAKTLPAAPEDILDDMEVWIPFSVDDFSPETVQVHLPLILAGSNEYRVPPLVWKADKEESHEEGWSWWGYTNEKVKVEGFTVDAGATGGFHGSSKVDDRLKVPNLQGNLLIYFPVDMKWRFASNEILFEDVSSGKIRQMHFQHLIDRSSVKVAFAAQFCCTRSAWMGWLPLGEARPEKVRIEFPSLIINGKEFVIKPITFELHRFEFGIYPFNC